MPTVYIENHKTLTRFSQNLDKAPHHRLSSASKPPQNIIVTPGQKFRQARDHHRVTRKSVMARTSLTYDQVNHAENDKNQQALQVMIEHYGPLWAIPEAWFYDGRPSPVPKSAAQEILYPIAQVTEKPSRYHPSDMVLLPVWKSVFAADDGDCWYYDEAIEQGEVSAYFFDAEPERYFLAQVLGHSLEDLAFTGDRLLVKRTQTPALSALVIAQSPEGHAVCKVLRPGVSQPYQLCSVNPATPHIQDLTGWTVIGEVRAIFLSSVAPPRPNIVWDYHRPIKIPSP